MSIRAKGIIRRIASKSKSMISSLYLRLVDIPLSGVQIERMRQRAIEVNHILKVGFIVQMPELWDKQEPVFNLMRSDEAFDPWLVVVPAYDFENGMLGEYGREKEFFIKASKGKYILARGRCGWRNVAEDCFDYVFYQRPYDSYLPKPLGSEIVSRTSRVCYIPYATPEMRETGIYPPSFFKNVYFGFMEDESSAQVNRSRYHDGAGRRFLNLGYPAFQKCLSLCSPCHFKSVLWTPRWSYDSIVGGSHFFEYVDGLCDYPWGAAHLTIRPHPMMWDNFLKEGLVDRDDVSQYLSRWREVGIEVDENGKIEDTFTGVDVLISDRSSVIALFFLTGKPIIYCEKKTDYGPLFATILPGLYIADSWNEVERYLEMLLDGDDPKGSLRRKIIEDEFSRHLDAAESIVGCIRDDANRLRALRT